VLCVGDTTSVVAAVAMVATVLLVLVLVLVLELELPLSLMDALRQRLTRVLLLVVVTELSSLSGLWINRELAPPQYCTIQYSSVLRSFRVEQYSVDHHNTRVQYIQYK
jgi:hypothetical protein